MCHQLISTTTSRLWILFKTSQPSSYLSLLHSSGILFLSSSFPSKSSSLLLYSYCKQNFRDKQTILLLTNIFFKTSLKEANYIDCLNFAFVFGKFDSQIDYSIKKLVWKRLFEEFEAKIDYFKKNELVTFAHAMALAGEGEVEQWRELQKRVNESINTLKWESLSIWAYALAKSGKGMEDSWSLIEKRLLTGNVDKLDLIASFCYSFSKSPLYGDEKTDNDHPSTSNSSPSSSNSLSPFALSSWSLPPLWRRFERATISLSHQMSSRSAVYLSTSFAKISTTPSPIIFTMIENYVMLYLEKETKAKVRCEEDGMRKEKVRNILTKRERLELHDLALILWAFDKMKVGSNTLWRLAAERVKQETNKLNYEDCINLIYGFKGRTMEEELCNILVERLKNIFLTWIREEPKNIRMKQQLESHRKEEEMRNEEESWRNERIELVKEKKELFESMRVNSLKLIFVSNPRGLEYWRDFGEITALSYLKSFEKAFRASQTNLDKPYIENYVDFLYISSKHGLSDDLRYWFGGMIHSVWEHRHLFQSRSPDYLNKLIFLVNKHKLAVLPAQEIKNEIEKFLKVEGAIENLAFFLVNCKRYRNLNCNDWRKLVEKKVKEAVKRRKVFADCVLGEEESKLMEILKDLSQGKEVETIMTFVLRN